MKRIDLTGQRFGYLLVTGYSHTNKFAYWNCVCDCGGTRVANGNLLRSGSIWNCGCKRRTRRKYRPMPNFSESDKKRFRAKVDKRGKHECWWWLASGSDRGYGQFGMGEGTPLLATRVSCYLSTGEDPKEQCVCHTCDNPLCVNPNHLWLGSLAEDNADAKNKKRTTFGECNAMKKLKEEDVLQILVSDELHRVRAKRFGVSRATIGLIKQGERWARCVR